MASVITIFIAILFGVTEILIYGKSNIKSISVPWIILLIGNFLLLYAKFAVGDDFVTLILYLPAMILLVISLIWFITILRKSIERKDNKRKKLAIIFAIIMTALIIFIPSLKKDDKFKLYKNDYFVVSEAIFQAYDEIKISVGDQFDSPPYSTLDLDELKTIFSKEAINKMKKLNRYAGVYSYIVADEDVIYFSFGATFQSIDGIAICRNGKDPSTDEALKSRYFDGCIQYTYILDGVYHFVDGL